MKLKTLLQQQKELILERALKQTTSRYPEEASRLIEDGGDRFQNPMGFTLRLGMKVILDGILAESDPAQLHTYLDSIIRIRAVQDFSPSDAVFFLTALKESLRQEAEVLVGKEEAPGGSPLKEWLDLEKRMDALFCNGFDIYMECREKVYQIRLEEMRSAYSYVRYNKR
jgi:hypothetical protein